MKRWGTVEKSMFTLFTVGTGEAWYLLATETADKNSSFTWVFVLYWFLGCIIMINMCAGIIVDNILLVQEEKQERRKHLDHRETTGLLAHRFLMFHPDENQSITRDQCLEGLKSPLIKLALEEIG